MTERHAQSEPAAGRGHTCPECGARLRAADAKCWLCGRQLTHDAEIVEATIVAPAWVESHQPPLKPWQFSLESMLLVITLVAVCLGMIVAMPGIGVLAAIVAAPALIRTLMVGYQERRAGHKQSMGEKVLAFLASTGVAIAVVLAGASAFGAACFASCLVVLGLESTRGTGGGGGQWLDQAIWVAIAFSSIVGLGTAGWLFWITRPIRTK